MRPHHVAPALLAIFTGACASAGLPDQPILKEYALKQTDFPLKSGLRVLVQEDHNTPLVVVSSVFGAGATSDPAGVEGIAHFVEHLAFRSRPGGGSEVWDHLKRMGASFNASTAADYTNYYAVAHKDHLPELLQLEAWRLARTIDGVTEEVFDIEREVVRNELRMRQETTVLNERFDAVLRQLFPTGHPLARPLAGTHTSLSAARLAHAQAFVKQHYRPDNCTIVIAGDVNPDEVRKMLGKWPVEVLFGPGGPDGPAVSPRKRLAELPMPQIPAPVSTQLVRRKAPVMNPELLIAWSAPAGYRGKDSLLAATASAVNVALGMGIELKERDDLVGWYAYPLPLADASVIIIDAQLRAGADPEKARTRILDAVAGAWSNETNRHLVVGAKWGTATQLLLASSDPVFSALATGSHLFSTGRSAFFKESFEQLAGLSGTEVSDFAYQYLRRDRAVSLFFEPEEGATARGAGGGSVVVAGGPRSSSAALPGQRHELGRSKVVNLTGMSPEDIRRIARPPGLAKLPRLKLPNGLQLIVARQTATPIAQLILQIPGGDATTQPLGLASVARLRSRTTCPDHGSLVPVGGAVGSSFDDQRTLMAANVLSGNLVNAVAVLSDEVRCREAEEESFLGLRQSMDERAERRASTSERPQRQSQERFWAELYPNHPLGQVDHDPKALRDISAADANSFVRGHYRPDGATLVIVGDVDVQEAQTLTSKYFGPWAAGRSVAATVPPVPAGPTGRTVHVFDREGATQSSIRVGCRLTSPSAEALPAFELIEGVAGEKAWELRESWGATYGVHASVSREPGGAAHLVLDGPVETPRTGAAIKRLLSLTEELGGDKLDVKTFTTARWDLARQYNRRFASGEAIAAALLEAEQNGWPADVWDRYPENLASTTRSSLREVMRPCVGREVVTVVGDAKAVKAQLAAEGIAVAN